MGPPTPGQQRDLPSRFRTTPVSQSRLWAELRIQNHRPLAADPTQLASPCHSYFLHHPPRDWLSGKALAAQVQWNSVSNYGSSVWPPLKDTHALSAQRTQSF